MFSLEKFYEDAHNGSETDIEGLCGYLKEFQNVIIWGAGNLGTAIGMKLQAKGIIISSYWDSNYKKIVERNGIKVIKTYDGDFDKNTTCVIFCIANVPVSPKLLAELQAYGWNHVVLGLALLEGMICPFSNEKEFDTGICNSMNICSVCACERLSNMMKYHVMREKNIKKEEVFSFDRIHFIVNNFCNLKCTHCFMYMNSYPPGRKRNVELEKMKRDIQILFEAVDSFGVVNIFGGEPFLHPDLSRIVEEIRKNKSFGSIIINTNGLAKIKEEQLEGLDDKRIRLAFSNYMKSISENQIEQFNDNVALVKKHNITVGIQNELPTWNISSTLCKNECSKEDMKRYKDRCGVKFLYVHNGKIFPCAMCLSINDMEIADYKTDYIDIETCKDAREVRSKMIEMINRDYYCTCQHCDQDTAITTIAGEQGYNARYALPKQKGKNV